MPSVFRGTVNKTGNKSGICNSKLMSYNHIIEYSDGKKLSTALSSSNMGEFYQE